MKLDHKEFYEAVKTMRDTQKKYFKTHDANVLQKSKLIEAHVDDLIKAYEESLAGGDLFSQEGK